MHNANICSSESLALGPQLSFRGCNYGEEGFLTHLKSFNSENGESSIDRILTSTLEGIHNLYGTGTSTANFVVSRLFSNLSVPSNSLHRSFSTIQSTIESVCDSLSFEIRPKLQPKDNEVQSPPEGNCDDTDWFFNNEPVESNDTGQHKSDSIESDTSDNLDSLFVGLQHCLHSDWETLGSPFSTDCLALPMKLVRDAAQCIWTLPSDGGDRSSISLFAQTLSEIQSKEKQWRSSDCSAYHVGCLKQSLEMVDVTAIHGIKMNCSRVVPKSVMFTCHMNEFTSAICGTAGERTIFNRIAVVCPEFADFGESIGFIDGFALGTSQQARSVAMQPVHTVDSFLGSDRSVTGTSKSIARLKQVGVTLLLCPEGIEDTPLLDACKAAGIAVLTMDRVKLSNAAKLCGAIIVENILELSEELVGRNSLILEMVHEVPAQTVSSTVSIIEGELAMDNDASEPCVLVSLTAVSAEKSICGGNPSQCECVSDFLWAHQQSLQPVSVLLCATTPLMAAALKDRFYRCLHRVRAALETGVVMPGAGLPELLIYLRLDEVIIQQSALLYDSADDSLHCEKSSDSHMEIEILKRFQTVLLDYCISILVNNGSTYAEAQQMVDESRLSLLHAFHSHEYRKLQNATYRDCSTVSVDGTIIDFVRSLTREEKCSLLKPIEITRIQGLSEIKNDCYMVDSDSSSSSDSSDSGFVSEEALANHRLDEVLDVPEITVHSFSAAFTALRLMRE